MADPRTINLPGSGTATQQYELAPGLIQYVQSVRVVVDNTAGADATPILSISEQSGVVIADVPQNGVLPAGEADGAATWALRLLGDTKAVTPPTPPGTQLAYAERTTPLNLDGTMRVFVTAPGVTLNGTTRIQVTWYTLSLESPDVAFTASNAFLFDGTSAIGLLASIITQGDAVGNYTVVTASRFLTPSAGFHTYSIRAQTTNLIGGGVIRAGPGGGGFDMPSFLRVTTA